MTRDYKSKSHKAFTSTPSGSIWNEFRDLFVSVLSVLF